MGEHQTEIAVLIERMNAMVRSFDQYRQEVDAERRVHREFLFGNGSPGLRATLVRIKATLDSLVEWRCGQEQLKAEQRQMAFKWRLAAVGFLVTSLLTVAGWAFTISLATNGTCP